MTFDPEMRKKLTEFSEFLRKQAYAGPPTPASELAHHHFLALTELLKTEEAVRLAFDAEGGDLSTVSYDSLRENIQGLVRYAEGTTANAHQKMIASLEEALIECQHGLRLNSNVCQDEVDAASKKADETLKALQEFRQRYSK